MSLVEHSSARHARTVLLDWMLGNACSYACSYCPKALHDGTVRWQKSGDILSFYDQLHQHYAVARGRRIWLQFTGGEPTMHPQIIRLLDEARARAFSVSLISNASRTPRFWEKIAPALDAVILTYHSEFADPDAFRAIAEIVAARMPVHINITMRPEVFDDTLGVTHDLRDALPGASFTLKPLRVDFGTELFDYTDDQRAIMAAGLPGASHEEGAMPRGTMTVRMPDGSAEVLRANELALRDLNHWQGYVCNAGLESLRITGDGRVSRAVCGAGGTLGRLGAPTALPHAPITCPKPLCGCVADMLITKTAPATEQPTATSQAAAE